MARGWALRGLACVAAVTVLATGCSQKQEPKAAAPSTTSAAPSPTLPPLGPADFPVPAEARQKTEAGIQAFTRYYVELTNHLLVTLDSAPLRDLSRNCEDCDALARGYDTAKASGWTYEGGQISILSMTNGPITGDAAETAFYLEQAAYTVKDRNGAPVPGKSSPSIKLSGGLALAWDASRSTWVVTTFSADRI